LFGSAEREARGVMNGVIDGEVAMDMAGDDVSDCVALECNEDDANLLWISSGGKCPCRLVGGSQAASARVQAWREFCRVQ